MCVCVCVWTCVCTHVLYVYMYYVIPRRRWRNNIKTDLKYGGGMCAWLFQLGAERSGRFVYLILHISVQSFTIHTFFIMPTMLAVVGIIKKCVKWRVVVNTIYVDLLTSRDGSLSAYRSENLKSHTFILVWYFLTLLLVGDKTYHCKCILFASLFRLVQIMNMRRLDRVLNVIISVVRAVLVKI